MSQNIDKKHWYDGWFYARFIDPWGKEIRDNISNFIESNSVVIDVGCGTGALVFELSKKCKDVVGIELSLKMIRFANQLREKENISNVQFIHADAVRLSKTVKQRFDYAITSLVLHEMSDDDRIKAVNEMKSIAKKIIIADFTAPQPKNAWGILTTFAEFLGGFEHFNKYKSFITAGGIEGVIEKCVMEVEKEIVEKAGTYKVVKATAI